MRVRLKKDAARVRVVNRRGHTQSTLRRRSAAAGTPPKGTKSEAYLKTEVQQLAQDRVEEGQYPLGLRVGSFTSLESATELVNSTLLQNRERVDRVARGESGGDFLRAFFDSPTRYEAYLPTPNSLPYMRDTYGVGVLIARDPHSANGYRVHSAYPIN
jgi:hypothetical protein